MQFAMGVKYRRDWWPRRQGTKRSQSWNFTLVIYRKESLEEEFLKFSNELGVVVVDVMRMETYQ